MNTMNTLDEIEELEPRTAPDGGETVLPLAPTVRPWQFEAGFLD